MAISHNPGTVFTVLKQRKWAVHGQPTLPTPVPLGGTDFHSHFRSPNHQNRIYYTNSNTTAHNSFWAFTDSSNVQKYFHNSVPCFGTDQQPIPGIYSLQAWFKAIFGELKTPKQPTDFLGSHGYSKNSQENSNNSVPCFGTDQTTPHGLKLTETSKNP